MSPALLLIYRESFTETNPYSLIVYFKMKMIPLTLMGYSEVQHYKGVVQEYLGELVS
jgi:hypothetical protein